jgi:hypothetical protein
VEIEAEDDDEAFVVFLTIFSFSHYCSLHLDWILLSVSTFRQILAVVLFDLQSYRLLRQSLWFSREYPSQDPMWAERAKIRASPLPSGLRGGFSLESEIPGSC